MHSRHFTSYKAISIRSSLMLSAVYTADRGSCCERCFIYIVIQFLFLLYQCSVWCFWASALHSWACLHLCRKLRCWARSHRITATIPGLSWTQSAEKRVVLDSWASGWAWSSLSFSRLLLRNPRVTLCLRTGTNKMSYLAALEKPNVFDREDRNTVVIAIDTEFKKTHSALFYPTP